MAAPAGVNAGQWQYLDAQSRQQVLAEGGLSNVLWNTNAERRAAREAAGQDPMGEWPATGKDRPPGEEYSRDPGGEIAAYNEWLRQYPDAMNWGDRGWGYWAPGNGLATGPGSQRTWVSVPAPPTASIWNDPNRPGGGYPDVTPPPPPPPGDGDVPTGGGLDTGNLPTDVWNLRFPQGVDKTWFNELLKATVNLQKLPVPPTYYQQLNKGFELYPELRAARDIPAWMQSFVQDELASQAQNRPAGYDVGLDPGFFAAPRFERAPGVAALAPLQMAPGLAGFQVPGFGAPAPVALAPPAQTPARTDVPPPVFGARAPGPYEPAPTRPPPPVIPGPERPFPLPPGAGGPDTSASGPPPMAPPPQVLDYRQFVDPWLQATAGAPVPRAAGLSAPPPLNVSATYQNLPVAPPTTRLETLPPQERAGGLFAPAGYRPDVAAAQKPLGRAAGIEAPGALQRAPGVEAPGALQRATGIEAPPEPTQAAGLARATPLTTAQLQTQLSGFKLTPPQLPRSITGGPLPPQATPPPTVEERRTPAKVSAEAPPPLEATPLLSRLQRPEELMSGAQRGMSERAVGQLAQGMDFNAPLYQSMLQRRLAGFDVDAEDARNRLNAEMARRFGAGGGAAGLSSPELEGRARLERQLMTVRDQARAEAETKAYDEMRAYTSMSQAEVQNLRAQMFGAAQQQQAFLGEQAGLARGDIERAQALAGQRTGLEETRIGREQSFLDRLAGIQRGDIERAQGLYGQEAQLSRGDIERLQQQMGTEDITRRGDIERYQRLLGEEAGLQRQDIGQQLEQGRWEATRADTTAQAQQAQFNAETARSRGDAELAQRYENEALQLNLAAAGQQQAVYGQQAGLARGDIERQQAFELDQRRQQLAEAQARQAGLVSGVGAGLDVGRLGLQGGQLQLSAAQAQQQALENMYRLQGLEGAQMQQEQARFEDTQRLARDQQRQQLLLNLAQQQTAAMQPQLAYRQNMLGQMGNLAQLGAQQATERAREQTGSAFNVQAVPENRYQALLWALAMGAAPGATQGMPSGIPWYNQRR